jgi:rubrerythrin
MPDTMDNLKTAFAGESQANRKYLAYAKKAEQDGFPNVARLFRAAAEAETVHALGHFQAMGMTGSTADNLRDAVSGETYEYEEMYPPMLAEAEQAGHKAKTMFKFASQAEKVHATLYAAALEAVLGGKDLDAGAVYVCPVCGHVELGHAPEKCPICGLKAERFQKVA